VKDQKGLDLEETKDSSKKRHLCRAASLFDMRVGTSQRKR